MATLLMGNGLPQSWGEYFRNVNPADYTDIIGEYPLSGKDDVDIAVKGCHKAFKGWCQMPVNDREKIINKFIMLLGERQREIDEMLTREQGKTLKEALGEPSRGIVECRYILGEGQRMEGIRWSIQNTCND